MIRKLALGLGIRLVRVRRRVRRLILKNTFGLGAFSARVRARALAGAKARARAAMSRDVNSTKKIVFSNEKLQNFFYKSLIHHYFFVNRRIVLRPWLHLINSRDFPSRMKGIHQVEPKREIALSRIWSSINENWTASSRKSLIREENNQWNFLTNPKQEIFEMCHLPKIERKFR